MRALDDHEAERLRGGASAQEYWSRQFAQLQRDCRSFWSLFQILARSAWLSMTGN